MYSVPENVAKNTCVCVSTILGAKIPMVALCQGLTWDEAGADGFNDFVTFGKQTLIQVYTHYICIYKI